MGGWVALGELTAIVGGLAAFWYFSARRNPLAPGRDPIRDRPGNRASDGSSGSVASSDTGGDGGGSSGDCGGGGGGD